MSYFSSTVAALLAGQTVRRAVLVHLDFLTQPKRVWQGFGTLVAGGQQWSGLGELGTISGLDAALGGNVPQATFGLSGVSPDLIADTLAASTEVKGRDVTVFLQFFDADWGTLDDPVAIYVGQMDVMKIKAQGATQRTIELTSEPLTVRQAAPPWGYLSDRDQNKLYPSGDRGLEMVSSMAFKNTTWPPAFDTSDD